MAITRQAVLEKLDGFLKGEISAEKIYEWALFIAVSSEYEQLVQKDPVISTTIQALISLNHTNKKQATRLEDLKLFRQCLAGEMTLPSSGAETREAAPAEPPSEKQPKKREKRRKFGQSVSGSMMTLRIYVVIFGICSLIVNLLTVIKPEWLSLGADVQTPVERLGETWLHISYAALLILPFPMIVRGPLFIAALPLFVFGMVYYWYVTVMLVAKLSLNLIFFLAVMPFSAIPATLALILLVVNWIEARDDMSSPQFRSDDSPHLR